jgi:membrane-associated protease RseP (regulator of RpoE activity)
MQPQQKFSGDGPGSGNQSGAIVCAQCGSPMPPEMRFCRACGNRLGEGPAEYTETVRLPNSAGAPGAAPFYPGVNAPLARQTGRDYPRRRRLGFSGMTWMWIVLGLFFASGGGLSMLVKNVGHIPRGSATSSATSSFLGVNGLDGANGGVTFADVGAPGTPADKAGLVGGDIITSFDGRAVTDEDEMKDLLRQTPIGKTVEVIYLRDGVSKKTQLTTVSEDEFNRLKEVFAKRPEGRGKFGFESFRTTVMRDQTRTYGVQINWVEQNGPADLFGIKAGDVITDFDNVPIRTSEELLSRVYRAKPHSSVEVVVLRAGQVLKIPVTMGRN